LWLMVEKMWQLREDAAVMVPCIRNIVFWQHWWWQQIFNETDWAAFLPIMDATQHLLQLHQTQTFAGIICFRHLKEFFIHLLTNVNINQQTFSVNTNYDKIHTNTRAVFSCSQWQENRNSMFGGLFASNVEML
jgi:hypothetical protein